MAEDLTNADLDERLSALIEQGFTLCVLRPISGIKSPEIDGYARLHYAPQDYFPDTAEVALFKLPIDINPCVGIDYSFGINLHTNPTTRNTNHREYFLLHIAEVNSDERLLKGVIVKPSNVPIDTTRFSIALDHRCLSNADLYPIKTYPWTRIEPVFGINSEKGGMA